VIIFILFIYARVPFNMMVLHAFTVVNCISVCPEIILDASQVRSSSFLTLHTHLTRNLLFFCAEILKLRSAPLWLVLKANYDRHQIKQFVN
jgi:hypothetical protein